MLLIYFLPLERPSYPCFSRFHHLRRIIININRPQIHITKQLFAPQQQCLPQRLPRSLLFAYGHGRNSHCPKGGPLSVMSLGRSPRSLITLQVCRWPFLLSLRGNSRSLCRRCCGLLRSRCWGMGELACMFWLWLHRLDRNVSASRHVCSHSVVCCLCYHKSSIWFPHIIKPPRTATVTCLSRYRVFASLNSMYKAIHTLYLTACRDAYRPAWLHSALPPQPMTQSSSTTTTQAPGLRISIN